MRKGELKQRGANGNKIIKIADPNTTIKLNLTNHSSLKDRNYKRRDQLHSIYKRHTENKT